MALGLGLGLIGFGAGASSGGGGGGGGFTLNPADNVNMTLSNGNTTASFDGLVRSQVRSITSHNVGKLYVEYKFSMTDASYFPYQSIGIQGAGISPPANKLGNDANAAASNNTYYYFNGAQLYLPAAFSANEVLAFAADLDAKKIWFRSVGASSAWKGAGGADGDPAAGTNGLDLSASSVTNWHVVCYADAPASMPSGSLTVNLGGTAFVGTPPAGFSAWG